MRLPFVSLNGQALATACVLKPKENLYEFSTYEITLCVTDIQS